MMEGENKTISSRCFCSNALDKKLHWFVTKGLEDFVYHYYECLTVRFYYDVATCNVVSIIVSVTQRLYEIKPFIIFLISLPDS